MTLRSLLRAIVACFQGDKPVANEFHEASQHTLVQYRLRIRRIMELRREREALTEQRATLRARKKKFTHLDLRLVEITTELLRLEKGV